MYYLRQPSRKYEKNEFEFSKNAWKRLKTDEPLYLIAYTSDTEKVVSTEVISVIFDQLVSLPGLLSISQVAGNKDLDLKPNSYSDVIHDVIKNNESGWLWDEAYWIFEYGDKKILVQGEGDGQDVCIYSRYDGIQNIKI